MNNDIVMINLDRPRQLKFNHTALKTLSSLTNKTILELDQNFDVTNLEFLEQLVYCGLLFDAKENGEKLSMDQITELLDNAPYFGYVAEKVVEAWKMAFGVKEVPEGKQQAEQQ